MDGAYLVAVAVVLAGAGAAAWQAARARSDTSSPEPVARLEVAALAPALMWMALLALWAGAVSTVCPEEVTGGTCDDPGLGGPVGLLLLTFPAAAGLALAWREGWLGAPAAGPTPTPDQPAEPAVPAPTARLDGEPAPVERALASAAERLRGREVALVFSGAAHEAANRELAELARTLAAPCFLASPDGPGGAAARAAAGADARSVDELALALAGGFYEGVVLLEGGSEFHPLTLATLRNVASVCLAVERSPTSDACAIVLPVEPGETADVSRARLLVRLRAHVEGKVTEPAPLETP